jgi:hypothetical protein
VNHYALPTHERTLQLLLDGLTAVAAAAPESPRPEFDGEHP